MRNGNAGRRLSKLLLALLTSVLENLREVAKQSLGISVPQSEIRIPRSVFRIPCSPFRTPHSAIRNLVYIRTFFQKLRPGGFRTNLNDNPS
jgi:hypothetical protein